MRFLCILSFTLFWINSAIALQFERLVLTDDTVMIGASGTIEMGDSTRFTNFIELMPKSDRIVGITINSTGGYVIEAEKLAAVVSRSHLPVIVWDKSICASSCFLIFAAASARGVTPNALVGVHSASIDGVETIGPMAMTTAIARVASLYKVPPGIIGRMVTTQPGEIAWLSVGELREMATMFFDRTPTVAQASTGSVFVNQSPNTAHPTSDAQDAFADGLLARKRLEAWFASLAGDAHDGALWWATVRSRVPAPTCAGPGGQMSYDWTAGCSEAQRRLFPVDVRRKNEPDFRRGWNSL